MEQLYSLFYSQISHAAWIRELECITEDIPLGLSAVRYYRFHRNVAVKCLKIYPVIIRGVPNVKGEPAHIIIETYDALVNEWKIVKEVKLPYYIDENPHDIFFDDLETNCLRVICDYEHPVISSHGEHWSNPNIVPFRILDKIEFIGNYLTQEEESKYNPPLIKGKISPNACENQQVVIEPHQIVYKSSYFMVGFSLRRPIITHLGWDDLGKGLSNENLIPTDSIWLLENSLCGPILRTVNGDIIAQHWTGEVEVDRNRVVYRNLQATDDYKIDLVFEVYEKGMDIHITKNCVRGMHAIEADDLRFVWNGKKCITGTLAMPVTSKGRVGTVTVPALWNAPGRGAVAINKIKGTDDVFLQVDSWRERKLGWYGLNVGWTRDSEGFLIMKKGNYSTGFRIRTSPIAPKLNNNAKQIPIGLQRNWPTGFTFRPERGGFSNNSISCNCHLSQYQVADLAIYTAHQEQLPSMLELLRYTVELALKGGPGYGDCRELYLDSDPSLIIAAGRVQQGKPDTKWVKSMWPFTKQACIRVMNAIDENGLLKCRALTGNSGSKEWSCNAWDVVGFGNYDAYSNVLAYRALKNAAGLAKISGDDWFSQKCNCYADNLKKAYCNCFLNEETGLLAGWRSSDNRLHDYAFTFINYMAICYRLVEDSDALKIIHTLEKMMQQAGLNYFYYGIPSNLISVRNEDAPEGNDYKREDGMDKYGIYINGCLWTGWVNYYIRALDMYGLKEKSDIVCKHIEQSFAENRIIGGMDSGTEFYTWEGRPCGYEGVLVGQFPVLAAIAIHRNIVDVAEPEWWING